MDLFCAINYFFVFCAVDDFCGARGREIDTEEGRERETAIEADRKRPVRMQTDGCKKRRQNSLLSVSQSLSDSVCLSV